MRDTVACSDDAAGVEGVFVPGWNRVLSSSLIGVKRRALSSHLTPVGTDSRASAN
jgi:hypothetical protein